MQRSRSSVGLGLPNFLSYYWPANAHKLLLWFTSPQSSWCQLESDSCTGISSSPQALACGTLPLPYSQYTSNPIVVASLKVWAQIRGHFKWSFLPQSTPICRNHLCASQNWSALHVPGQKGSAFIERFVCGRVICEFQPATSHIWISQFGFLLTFSTAWFCKNSFPRIPAYPNHYWYRPCSLS